MICWPPPGRAVWAGMLDAVVQHWTVWSGAWRCGCMPCQAAGAHRLPECSKHCCGASRHVGSSTSTLKQCTLHTQRPPPPTCCP